jgi:hypothetical protein
MINDPKRLYDGFDRIPKGMDGSKDPTLTPKDAVYYGENVIFRGGGGAKSRPGFKSVPLTGFSGTPGLLLGAIKVQGACVLRIPSSSESLIVIIADGSPLLLDIVKKTITVARILGGELNPVNRVYFCQVQEHLIVQDGLNPPVILSMNGSGLDQNSAAFYSKNTPIPIGKQMAYGQGRLFVASTDGRTITAGDIAFGGSTTAVGLKSSTDDDEVVLTTESTHTFNVGDYVTISGHSSFPTINGTFQVKTVPSTSQLTIAAAVGIPGTGGVVTKFNAGQSKDALIFSENTFINEGGTLSVPSEMGSIQSLNFLPLQDTATGQGDLIVFCNRGAASFSVSVPRAQWKDTPNFQKVLFSNIGSASEMTAIINGDVFFRSREGNGIRSYRSARGEFGSFGQTPISAEMDSIFSKENLDSLSELSMIYFDDRLLMTCNPQITGARVFFKGIAALDFRPVSTVGNKSSAVYDGVWTGLRILKLISAVFGGVERAFAVCDDSVEGVSLWEITKEGLFDEGVTTKTPIRSLILTRGFNFEKPYSEKKLVHCDLWFSGVGGYGTAGTRFRPIIHYRQDNNPNWVGWGDWNLCFSEGSADAVFGYAQLRTPSISGSGVNEFTGKSSPRGFDFKLRVEWSGHGKLEKLLLHSLELVEPLGPSPYNTECLLIKRNDVPDSLGDFQSSTNDTEVLELHYLLLDDSPATAKLTPLDGVGFGFKLN